MDGFGTLIRHFSQLLAEGIFSGISDTSIERLDELIKTNGISEHPNTSHNVLNAKFASIFRNGLQPKSYTIKYVEKGRVNLIHSLAPC